MAIKTYIPEGQLSPYVEFLWYSNGYDPISAKERLLPNGASQLIINLGNDKFRYFDDLDQQKQEYNHTIITGIHTGHLFLDSTTRISTMGVVLRPGAISSLFGIPAAEFENQVVVLDDILQTDISAFRQKLISASTPGEKFQLLEVFLCRNLNPDFQINPAVIFAVEQIDNHHGTIPISDILNNIGYSRRWFSKVFKDTAGITPKQYARICRFQYVLKLIRKINNPNWASLASTCGYFDQSHFIHDFKDLAGISPSEYLLNQSDQKNHLPV